MENKLFAKTCLEYIKTIKEASLNLECLLADLTCDVNLNKSFVFL